MKIEKLNFNGKEVDLAIYEDDDMETNEIFEEELETTKDLSKLLDNNEVTNE